MAPKTIKITTLCNVLGFVLVTELLGWWCIRQTGYLQLMILGITRTVQAGGILWIVVKRETGLQAIGWAPHTWLDGVKKGALWSLGFAIAAAVGMTLLSLFGRDPIAMLHTPLPATSIDRLLIFVVGGLIAPLAEEICFRGILYTFFRQWGFVLALLVSTVLFVVLHSVHGLPVPQIVGGLLFAVAYETSGNLMVPITIHMLGNLAIFTLSLPTIV